MTSYSPLATHSAKDALSQEFAIQSNHMDTHVCTKSSHVEAILDTKKIYKCPRRKTHHTA